MEAGLVPQPLTRSHPPLVTGGQGQGDWCSCSCLWRLLDFSAQAKKGANHTINKLYFSQQWRGQSDLFIIPAVHANRALLPSKP